MCGTHTTTAGTTDLPPHNAAPYSIDTDSDDVSLDDMGITTFANAFCGHYHVHNCRNMVVPRAILCQSCAAAEASGRACT